MNRNMWAPLGGVGFLIIAIIAIALGGEPPDAGHEADEIVSHYLDNKDSIEISSRAGGARRLAPGFLLGRAQPHGCGSRTSSASCPP